MAGIKKLKKEIKKLSDELIEECYTFKTFHPETGPEKIDSIVLKIKAKLREIIYDINHLKLSVNKKPRLYYDDIIAKVKKELVPLLDEIGKLKGK
jgi:hypothetical protein